MANAITIKIKVKPIAHNAYELRTVMRGRFFKRQYIGFTKQEAIKRFEKWLGEQK